jgi:sec-independent protein translocase protein TatB
MHFADSIFIFLLALVLFGPKRLPEIGRQIGKLLAEFRRASNEFKMQIDDELRNIDRQEQQKKLEAQSALTAAASTPESSTDAGTLTTVPTILPPDTGAPVSASSPFVAETSPETSPEQVPAQIPEQPQEQISESDPSTITTTEASAVQQAHVSLNGASHSSEQEHESTSLHHG